MTDGIVAILIADSNVQTLIGENKASDKYKVYPVVVPQGEVHPYIAVKTTSRPPIECKGQRPSGFTPSVTVFCYAQNYEDVLDIEAAVIDAVDGKAGGNYGSVNLTYLRYVNSSEDFVQTNDGVGLYVRMPQFEAQENASSPT
jgi:hypothetical protein